VDEPGNSVKNNLVHKRSLGKGVTGSRVVASASCPTENKLNHMKNANLRQSILLRLTACTILLAGCAGLPNRAPNSEQASIQAVFTQIAQSETKGLRASLLSDQQIADLEAIDVQGCSAHFRSAWFDYLVQVRNLYRRAERVALIAAAAGKPVTNLPELIKVAAASPALGQYLLNALDQTDAAREKLERSAMNYGVMPKP
jgi:hypothetical protein